jgi:preprotein translocase subunit Sec63
MGIELTQTYLLAVLVMFVSLSMLLGLLLAFGITRWVKHSWRVTKTCIDNDLVNSNHSRAIDVLSTAVDIGKEWKSFEVPVYSQPKSEHRRRVGDV